MIKGKTKFTQTNFEAEELGGKNRLMQDAGTLTPNGDLARQIYKQEDFNVMVNPTAREKEGDGVPKYVNRIMMVSPHDLTNLQLEVLISRIGNSAAQYSKEHKGAQLPMGSVDKLTEAYKKEQEIRSNYRAQYASEEHKLALSRNLDLWQKDGEEILNKANPLIAAQKEANRLKNKEIDMNTLNVNEFKALDIIVKYQLQDPNKLDELLGKAKAGDTVAEKDLKNLGKYLFDDNKINPKTPDVIDALKDGVRVLVSENSEAILKYAKAQEAIHSLGGAAKAVPGQEVDKTLQLK